MPNGAARTSSGKALEKLKKLERPVKVVTKQSFLPFTSQSAVARVLFKLHGSGMCVVRVNKMPALSKGEGSNG